MIVLQREKDRWIELARKEGVYPIMADRDVVIKEGERRWVTTSAYVSRDDDYRIRIVGRGVKAGYAAAATYCMAEVEGPIMVKKGERIAWACIAKVN